MALVVVGYNSGDNDEDDNDGDENNDNGKL